MNVYDKIIVAHYGKVGSNSLVFSLAKQLNCERKHIKNNKINYHQKILTTFNNYHNVLKVNKNKKILFITISRNLIERDISMQFQLKGNDLLKKIKNNEMSEDDIIISLKKRKLISMDDYFEIFEKEFNINIYSELNKNKKFLFKQNVKDNIDFLFLKFEEIKYWEDIFKTIFNFELRLEKYNYSGNKLYNSLYKLCLKEVLNDNKIINRYKNTKHYQIYL